MWPIVQVIRDCLRANVTPNYAPGRVLSNAAGTTNVFQPSLTRPVFVSYTALIDFSSSVDDSDAHVELRCGPTNPPTNPVGDVGLAYNIGGLLTALDAAIRGQLSFLVPKGHYVAIVPVTTAGTVSFSLLHQVETPA